MRHDVCDKLEKCFPRHLKAALVAKKGEKAVRTLRSNFAPYSQFPAKLKAAAEEGRVTSVFFVLRWFKFKFDQLNRWIFDCLTKYVLFQNEAQTSGR